MAKRTKLHCRRGMMKRGSNLLRASLSLWSQMPTVKNHKRSVAQKNQVVFFNFNSIYTFIKKL